MNAIFDLNRLKRDMRELIVFLDFISDSISVLVNVGLCC